MVYRAMLFHSELTCSEHGVKYFDGYYVSETELFPFRCHEISEEIHYVFFYIVAQFTGIKEG